MAETLLWRSPLAQLGRDSFALPGGAIELAERSRLGKFLLRGAPDDEAFLAAVKTASGLELPRKPNSSAAGGAVTALWTQPDEWLIVCEPEETARIGDSLATAGLTVTEVGEGRAALRLGGPKSIDLLRKGTSLNLHPRIFRPGDCAQTKLAQCGVLLHRPGEAPVYDIFCERSFAEYLWLWFEDAAPEFGEAG
jgi:sarcosine oxidase subunit gamma